VQKEWKKENRSKSQKSLRLLYTPKCPAGRTSRFAHLCHPLFPRIEGLFPIAAFQQHHIVFEWLEHQV